MRQPERVVLAGRTVRIEPLEPRHAPELLLAAADPEIWLYLPVSQPAALPEMEGFIAAALGEPDQLPFAIVSQESGRAIGSTRFLEIRPADRALEIGWTWYARAAQRTAANTECKYLLLDHAFGTLGAQRVQFKTDRRNVRSQRALERIGAVQEGILRKHRVLHDGYVRDSVYYSILDDEWPAVRLRLEELLRRGEQ